MSEAEALAFLATMWLFLFVVTTITYIIAAIFLGLIFKKAGVASWIAWVPVYNSWKLLEIGGQKGFWSLFSLAGLSIITAIFIYISMYNIGLKFGKSGTFILLGIFFAPIWLIWIALDASKWNNMLGEPSVATEHTPAQA
jgi:hypothetical protein